ncbi:hypothetical protein AQUCO_02500367v1 [Aquilegia coerulea]|uniref:Uncharacterized protein n=1 Tax=Aquilegia coerulea TaxID=218851 RepID=A0A2G5DAS8_AQUCA|nr:hypothetical protein AQUCO_02500367v1 [Aquilegia coerulea]
MACQQVQWDEGVFSAREKGFLVEAKIKTNNKGYFAALSVGRRHGSGSICIPAGRVGEGWKESGNLFCNVTNESTTIRSSEFRETRETSKDLCYCLTDLLNARQTFEVLSYACGSVSLENLVVIEGDQTLKLKLEISDPRNIPRIIPFVDGLEVRAAIVELDEVAINEDMAQFNGFNGGGSKAESYKFSNVQVDELQAKKLVGHRSPPSSVFEELTKSGDGSVDSVENLLETAEKNHCSLTPEEGEREIVDDRRDETGRDNRLPVRAVNQKPSKEKQQAGRLVLKIQILNFKQIRILVKVQLKSDEAQAVRRKTTMFVVLINLPNVIRAIT